MQPILQHLFQASSLDDISRQRLETFVEEYPSFGIGHYLLSRKLQAEDSERFAVETQKTSLYFTNPFWLQWQLDHIALAGGSSPRAIAAEAPDFTAPSVAEVPVFAGDEPVAVSPEPVAAAQEHIALAEAPASFAEENAVPAGQYAATEEPAAVEEPVIVAPNVVAMAEESLDQAAGDDLAESFIDSRPAELTLDEERSMTAGEGEEIAGEPVPVAAAEVAAKVTAEAAAPEAANGSSAADQLLRSIEEAKGLRESLQKINDDLEPASGVAGEPQPVAATEEAPIRDEEPPFVLEEAETPVAQAAPEPSPAAHAEPALVFEPYHTIDYFASQGIKLSLDENPNDQLGKQLKSFTDWLKGMRRLPQKDREVIPDRVAEQAVQNFAAHSIEGKDVLTETMAEVLVKQGMRERARAVYEKLSLLNPGKRAYFAAKIEQLNNL